MKHQPYAAANAAALTTAFVYVVCAVFVALAPELSLNIAQSWFHGLDLSLIVSNSPATARTVWGLVTSSGFAWVVGYVFAGLYNYFLKGKK